MKDKKSEGLDDLFGGGVEVFKRGNRTILLSALEANFVRQLINEGRIAHAPGKGAATVGAEHGGVARGPCQQPPMLANAEFLLCLFLPWEVCEGIIGDLEEEFLTCVLPRHGLRRALFWYRWQVFWTVLDALYGHARRLVGIKALAKTAELIFQRRGGG
ncbi:MAG: hypothetical protein MJA83_00915 [Gammaproteobacteria bacterium]|nr:hypothetical protein [Gammaproteobacteria bacterium]